MGPLIATLSLPGHRITKLKDVITVIQEAGFKVIATVCDQASKNKAAINELCRQTSEHYIRENLENKYFGFLINKEEIVPLFDAPYMRKGIRNNLLKADTIFKWKNSSSQRAPWKVIQQLYEMDSPDDMDYRLFYTLSDAHIYEAKMNKIKVNLAEQIFSQRLASNIKFMTQSGLHFLPTEAEGTAEFVLFMDKLFECQWIFYSPNPWQIFAMCSNGKQSSS